MNKAESTSSTIRWEGKHAFFISGTIHQDDSLQITSNAKDMKLPLTLTLPTLCITYADMAFANAIGGVQADYPESQAYGAAYFDPPVTLSRELEIRKYTWIRGAKEVTIGAKETIIRWLPWDKLVIPKLRISAKEPVKALLNVPEVFISVDHPLEVQIKQFTNGRHVGGIKLNKTHPDWNPEDKNEFDLWAQIVDEETGRAVPETQVNLSTWNEEESRYVTYKEWRTDKDGLIRATGVPCQLMMLTVENASYDTMQWEFRPFSGQQIKRILPLTHSG